jgi:2-keto-4-pentenoate hydratase
MSVWSREDLRAAFGRQLSSREAAVAGGATAFGWKLGFGVPAALANLGIDAPLVGYLLGENVLGSGASVSLEGWTTPKIETEIAIFIGADLPAGAPPVDCVAAVDGLALAFELVDFVVTPSDPVEILDRNVFQRRVVLGERVGVRPLPPVDLIRNGETIVAGAEHAAAVGELGEVLSHLASVLGTLGPGLAAGDVVITGALAPAGPLVSGESYGARADGLGEISLHAVA